MHVFYIYVGMTVSFRRLQPKTGLPISTYFSAVKLRWLLDNVHDVAKAVQKKNAMFGTVDSWIIWVSATRRPPAATVLLYLQNF